MTEMPTLASEPWIDEHKYAKYHHEAHPIDDGVVETAAGRLQNLVACDLSAVQSIAAQVDLPDSASARLVEEETGIRYYQVDSSVFYQLLAAAVRYYDAHIEIERAAAIADAHTIQFAADVHGYEGDFEGEDCTLCNALNDGTTTEGAITSEVEPEEAHYGFVDSRGLVVEAGTHDSRGDIVI